ncbi:MAG: hypothetical protein HND52_01140 [Ignavibacteriae bacterium]|nr:hypothetical protein [Ignavibacteriota bacterium]NOG96554.1 hypothetical protein [Ignavibacteriota bacterium]
MNNKIICGNCGEPNAFFKLNCTKCNAVIRNKVVNIDLWSILWKIVETPKIAFTQIIQAENKNFVFSLLFLIGFKLFLHTFFLSSSLSFNDGFNNSVVLNALISLGYLSVIIFLFTFIIFRIVKAIGIDGRFRDYYSILIYALVPFLFSLLLLTPVEYALFGKHWFIANPAPFAIKAMAAWVLTVLEVLFLIWSIFLVGIAIYLQTNKKLLTLLITASFFILLSAMVFILPYFPF